MGGVKYLPMEAIMFKGSVHLGSCLAVCVLTMYGATAVVKVSQLST